MWLISQYTFFLTLFLSFSFFFYNNLLFFHFPLSYNAFTITFSFSIFLYLIMDIQEFSPSIPVECYNEPLNNFYHEELSPLIPVECYNESLNNENMDTDIINFSNEENDSNLLSLRRSREIFDAIL